VLGGKTYLSGEVKTLKSRDGGQTPVAWSKQSGPGEVAFEKTDAPVTTATFSKVGQYVLKLTAGKSPLATRPR
jgi:hypothetical protein